MSTSQVFIINAWQMFSVRDQMAGVLGSAGPTLSATTPARCCLAQSSHRQESTNECDCVPTQLYLQT